MTAASDRPTDQLRDDACRRRRRRRRHGNNTWIFHSSRLHASLPAHICFAQEMNLISSKHRFILILMAFCLNSLCIELVQEEIGGLKEHGGEKEETGRRPPTRQSISALEKINVGNI